MHKARKFLERNDTYDCDWRAATYADQGKLPMAPYIELRGIGNMRLPFIPAMFRGFECQKHAVRQ
jgi:hypothetical protein